MGFLKSKKILVFAVVLFSIMGFIFYFFYGTPWDMIAYKSKFETYLEDKYNQDFVIKEISYDFLHGGTYHAYAFSKNYPEVTFHIGQNPKLNEIDDAYHYEMWRYQAKNEISPIIEDIFPNRINHAVEVKDFIAPHVTENSNVPNFRDIVTLEIGIAMNHTKITKENEETEMKKAFRLLEALYEKDVNIGHFGISYKNKTLQINSSEIKSVNEYVDVKKWFNDYEK
ncbi:hypothetical protein [Salirhabdus salicampi]|uniref:hypothetical protein n=1 Tax=Salirhabdus salicampi TaxID=476102 RepID=UPI0020C3DC96|nr:hypothetical protein [Salirhabdus salicampi]MCP8616146.1 hypothetical protein [Salirhabdus salicampi]